MANKKNIYKLLILCLLLAGCTKEQVSEEPAETNFELFKMTDLPSIYLEIDTNQWNTLLRNFDKNPMNEKYIFGSYSFSLNSKIVTLDSIGIRIRGNSSRRRPEGSTSQLHSLSNPDWHHSHFALNFDKYIDDQRFNGLEKINLKWFKDDPSYVKEVYCYDLFERFGVWTAPQSSYCLLTIKIKGDQSAAYFGVYQMVESIDEDYLLKRGAKWGAAEGFLWKGGWAGSDNANFASIKSIGVEDVNINPSKSKYYAYDLKNRKSELVAATDELTNFITNLNSLNGTQFEQWITSVMDVDLFLKTYAVNVIVGMWDDYWTNANNFYFYFAKNNKAYFIPYDYDNTLGTSLFYNSGTKDMTEWGPMDQRPLITKILAIPAYMTKYKSYIKDLASVNNSYFNKTASLSRIEEWQNRVGQYVSNATDEDMTISDAPATWGNAPFYRLKSGDDTGGTNGTANFFDSKIKSIWW